MRCLACWLACLQRREHGTFQCTGVATVIDKRSSWRRPLDMQLAGQRKDLGVAAPRSRIAWMSAAESGASASQETVEFASSLQPLGCPSETGEWMRTSRVRSSCGGGVGAGRGAVRPSGSASHLPRQPCVGHRVPVPGNLAGGLHYCGHVHRVLTCHHQVVETTTVLSQAAMMHRPS